MVTCLRPSDDNLGPGDFHWNEQHCADDSHYPEGNLDFLAADEALVECGQERMAERSDGKK